MSTHLKHFRFYLLLAICLAAQTSSFARDLTVSATAPGAYRTIQSAINAAQPGDVIRLEPKAEPYREIASFRNKSGTVENPIVLDGQGATLNGSEPLRADEWEKTEAGAYRSTTFMERRKMGSSMVGRFYFIMNGSANRMGHSAKGNRGRYKAVADLQPGEWTYEAKEKAFYIVPPTGQDIEAVWAPERATGVAISGDCENLTIRNLTATHVWNDGFNIHGRTRNVRFENIRAIECGDDGISAHEDCQIVVDGFFAQRNSTGMCHINQSQSDNRNIILEDNLGYSIYLLNDSKHTITNAVIRSTRGFAFHATLKTEVTLKNVLFDGQTPGQSGLLINAEANVTAHNISAWNLPLTVDGASLQLHDSVIGGDNIKVKIAPTANWKADHNLWGMNEFNFNGTAYLAANYADYVKVSGQDVGSHHETLSAAKLLQGAYAPQGIRPPGK